MALTNSSQISVVGLGNMGTALSHALRKAGKELMIWNRTATKPSITSLVNEGAVLGPSLSHTISSSAVTIICVLDYPTIYEILKPIAGSDALKSKIIINLSNGTPNEARQMAEWMHTQGVSQYFDGGIMATPDMIATPDSSIFVSGEGEQRFSSVSGIIEIFGTARYMGEDPGAAALYDLALLTGMYGMFSGVMTAMAMMQKHSVATGGKASLESLVEGILNPWIEALIPYHVMMARSVDTGNFDPLGNPIGMQSTGLQNILRACEEEGVDGSSLRYFAGLLQKVVEEHGPEGGLAQVESLLLK